MRTTIDVPKELLERARVVMVKRGMTFRALVLDALEQALGAESAPFSLRDASAGTPAGREGGVSPERINEAIEEQRKVRRRS